MSSRQPPPRVQPLSTRTRPPLLNRSNATSPLTSLAQSRQTIRSRNSRNADSNQIQENNPPDNVQVSEALHKKKRKYDEFAAKAVFESSRKSTNYDVLTNYQKAGKYWCLNINPISNVQAALMLGLKLDRKEIRTKEITKRQIEREEEAERLGIAVEDLAGDESDTVSEDSDDEDDLDDDLDEQSLARLQVQKTRQLSEYNRFKKRFPKLHERLLETLEYHDRETFKACLTTISETRDQKQRGNSAALKDRVLTWIPQVWDLKTKATEGPFPYPLTKADKSNRGVSNKIIALLFTPHAQILPAFGKSSVKRTEILLQLQNHDIPLLADGFPAFLYDTSVAVQNPKNRWAGYMRGPLLLYTLRTIYTSPSSATGPKAKKTKKGNAALLKLDLVTPEMLACAALQLRFALCTLQEYANVDGLFSFEEFYYFVLDSIYAGMSKGKWGEELFEWWNCQVFGDKLAVPDQPGPSYDDPFGGDPDVGPGSQDVDADTDTEE